MSNTNDDYGAYKASDFADMLNVPTPAVDLISDAAIAAMEQARAAGLNVPERAKALIAKVFGEHAKYVRFLGDDEGCPVFDIEADGIVFTFAPGMTPDDDILLVENQAARSLAELGYAITFYEPEAE